MKTIRETLPRRLRQLLDPSKTYVAAVSGGPDSLALAEGLCRAGFHFHVCHVEHGIRGRASLEDARFVETYCRERDIPFRCVHVQALEKARAEGLSPEDAARRLRYDALRRYARETGADYILTAHQKDDQAETFLLRLLRGAGTLGLAGMRFRRDGILRPLLSCRSAELREFCQACGLTWREDATNEDRRYVRNRIRKDLLPYLGGHFGGDMTEILSRTAEHLQQDADFLETLARQALPGVTGTLPLAEAVRYAPGLTRDSVPAGCLGGQVPYLSGDAWRQLDPALRFRVLRLFIRQAGEQEELTTVNLRNVAAVLLRNRTGKKIPLPGCWQCTYTYGKLFLLPKSINDVPATPSQWETSLSWEDLLAAPRQVVLPDGRTLRFEVLRGPVAGLPFRYRDEAVYPLAQAWQMAPVLTVRFRRGGEDIAPLKGIGRKSLKRYLIDCRMPVAERASQPVVAAGDTVLWLPGFANAAWDGRTLAEAGRQEEEILWLTGKLQ